MLSRLTSLQRRLDSLRRDVRDIQTHLNAMTQAPIEHAVNALSMYERSPAGRADDLKVSKDKSGEAAAVYKGLVRHEVGGQRRLSVLNHCGRCYTLALLTHIRCLVFDGAVDDARHRLDGERETLRGMAEATFSEVLGRRPEAYLDPRLRPDDVTLELLADVYGQARRAGVSTGISEDGPAGLFEHLRPRVFGAGRGMGRLIRGARRARAAAVTKLRFLLACLEDVNRVEAMRLRLEHAAEHGYSLVDLEAEMIRQGGDPTSASLGAVGFAFA
jgi:hypothetical protein